MQNLDDIDLESAEAIVKNGQSLATSKDQDREKKSRERSPRDRSMESRESSHRRSKRSSDRDRDRDRGDREHRRRSRSRSSRRRKRSGSRSKRHQRRSRSNERRYEDRGNNKYDDRRRKNDMSEEDRLKKEQEEAHREDCTVLVNRFPPDANEKDIYMFFSKAKIGKVRDVRVIRDLKTGRSKSIAYVEFYTPEAVLQAIPLTGQEIRGQQVVVQASRAAVNRAAQAQKLANKQNKANPSEDGPFRVYVGGLTDTLSDITEENLKKLFEVFGEIQFIDLHRDPLTRRSKGYAFIQFRFAKDGRTALDKMNGFEIGGKKIKVGPAADNRSSAAVGAAGVASIMGTVGITGDGQQQVDLDDESGQSYLHNPQSRVMLMQKLARDDSMQNVPQLQGNIMQVNQQGGAVAYAGAALAQMTPTNCLLLKNMFSLSDPEIRQNADYFIEIKEDVMDECRQYGECEYVWVNSSSHEGEVWVKFAPHDIEGARQAFNKLDKRLFGGRQISAIFLSEAEFNSVAMRR